MNYIGLDEKNLKKVGYKLNVLLASYSVYYQNLRSFHWHIKGHNFFDMHELFEELYNDAKVKIDDIAERILTINQKPLGSMAEYLEHSQIAESADVMTDVTMSTIILENHTKLIEIMREVISIASTSKDEGTVISSFLSSLEKNSWIINAWLDKRGSE